MLKIGASVELDAVAQKALDGSFLVDMREGVVDGMAEAVADWYASLPQDWFDNPEPFPDGTSRRTRPRRWMYGLSETGRGDSGGWQAEWEGDTLCAFFVNPEKGRVAYGLRMHQYGTVDDPITPKTAAALTIPLTAEAQGVRAMDFPHELFMVQGEAAKADPELIGTLVWEDESGKLHAAYALRTASRIPPLKERRGHDAIPGEVELARMAHDAFTAEIDWLLSSMY